MAEKVLIAQTRSPSRTVLMNARVARALVALGAFKYVTAEVVVEEPKKPKKRTYKRRDMRAGD